MISLGPHAHDFLSLLSLFSAIELDGADAFCSRLSSCLARTLVRGQIARRLHYRLAARRT